MKALLIPLTLESPLLITNIGNGDENSSRSLPFIPGGMLRGALVGLFRSEEADLLRDETAVRLFFGVQVVYLNAYPATDKKGQQRTLPTPASWRKEKGTRLKDKPESCDFALTADDKFDQGLQSPFCNPEARGNLITLFKPNQELTTHISGEDRGMVKAENNTVFQYQALREGQIFTAVILTRSADDRSELKTLLTQNPILYLGRSRSARYGRVQVGAMQEKDDWPEAPQQKLEGKTVLTLLSDALLRDENGQPTHDLVGWLARRLGKDEITFEASQRFIKPALTGGFNRKWGLPLPQTPALGMGSVFVFDSALISPDELTGLVENGIGERRVDGFGRIAVNWQAQDQFRIEEFEPHKPPLHKNLTPNSQKLAQDMAERILRQRLDAHLSETVHRYDISGNINNHQLSRLRGQLRQAINAGGQDTKAIETFIEKLKPTAKDQYRRARVHFNNGDSGRLLTWLEEQLEKKAGLSISRIPEIAGKKAELTGEIKTEYTLRLIEAVVNKRMKANREVKR